MQEENFNEVVLDNQETANVKYREKKSILNRFKFMNKGFWNVINLGISFFLLFAAFGTTQSFITTLRKQQGFVSLTILYATFSFSNFLAPAICKFLSDKWTLFIGALCYSFFVFSAAFDSDWLLYSSAVVNGFGAAILWTAQGSLLTKSANYNQLVASKNYDDNNSTTNEKKKGGEVMGFFSGLFFAIYQLNFIIGNLLTGALINAGISNFWIFTILGIIALAASLSMIGLRSISDKELTKLDTKKNEEISKHETINDVSTKKVLASRVKQYFVDFWKLFKGSVLILFSTKMILFSCISFYSGYSSSFFTGSLPPVIGKNLLGWVMIVFGIMQVTGALISGKLCDFIGKRKTMTLTLVFHFIAIMLSFQMVYWGGKTKTESDSTFVYGIYALYFIEMALLALSDAFLTNCIYAILGSKNYYKKEKTAEAFAAFKMCQALSSAIGFFCGIYLNILTIQIILSTAYLVCIAAFIIMDIFIASVDKEKKFKTNEKEKLLV
ncbi:hypothetical protein ABK040_004428 [Willaertia magna]